MAPFCQADLGFFAKWDELSSVSQFMAALAAAAQEGDADSAAAAEAEAELVRFDILRDVLSVS